MIENQEEARVYSDLKEEMADVLIMIEQLKCIFDITDDELEWWIQRKQKRVFERMKKEKQNHVG